MKANFDPPAELGGTQLKALIVGVVGIAISIGTGIAAGGFQLVAQSAFVAYIFWVGIAIGSLGLLMVQYLGGGGWGLVIRRILESGAHTLWLMLALFLLIVVGLGLFSAHPLFDWVHPEQAHYYELWQSPNWNFKRMWLSPTFFIVRGLIYFAIWIGLATKLRSNSHRQDETGDPAALQSSQNWSGPGFLIFGLALTFAAVDWVMSLDPEWFSTIIGMLMLAGWGVATIGLIIWTCVTLAKRDELDHVYQTKLFHDLGKLQFALTMVWTYFSFSQLVIIWSGNLPEEIPFYLERFKGPWRYLGLAIILLHFVLPFLLLLSRDLKRNRNKLKYVSLLLIGMRFFDLYWYIVPEFENRHHGAAHEAHFPWLIPVAYAAAFIGLGGIWFWWMLGQLRKRSLLPVNDPQLTEALTAGGHH
jgi:hypothetical protein